MWNLGLTIFLAVTHEHQYFLLVNALDQQHCSIPLFLICENNFLRPAVISSYRNYETFTFLVQNHILICF